MQPLGPGRRACSRWCAACRPTGPIRTPDRDADMLRLVASAPTRWWTPSQLPARQPIAALQRSRKRYAPRRSDITRKDLGRTLLAGAPCARVRGRARASASAWSRATRSRSRRATRTDHGAVPNAVRRAGGDGAPRPLRAAPHARPRRAGHRVARLRPAARTRGRGQDASIPTPTRRRCAVAARGARRQPADASAHRAGVRGRRARRPAPSWCSSTSPARRWPSCSARGALPRARGRGADAAACSTRSPPRTRRASCTAT